MKASPLLFYVALFSLLVLSTSANAWWNNSFSYRQPINATVGSNVDDYNQSFNLTYNAHMNVDFSDLRFVNASDNTLLNYWIEDEVNSSWALIWVRFDHLTTANGTVGYMYYGNATSSDAGNCTKTHAFCDDFNRADNNDVGNGWTETGGTFNITSNTLWAQGDGAGGDTCISGAFTTTLPLRFVVKAKAFQTNTQYKQLKLQVAGADKSGGFNFHSAGKFTYLDVVDWQDSTLPYATNTYYRQSMLEYANASIIYWYYYGSGSNTTTVIGGIPNDMAVGFYNSAGSMQIDYMFVDGISLVEPTTVFGAEEGLPATPNLVNILTPANGTNVYQKNLNITGICNSSSTLINATLDYNGTQVANASAITSGNAFYFNQSVSSEGQYYYNLTCTNAIGDNTSETRVINITRTVTTCSLLNEPNWYYTLAGNIAGSSGTVACASGYNCCIGVVANNITLECNYHDVNNTGNIPVGIDLNADYATIQNCFINNFTSYGLRLNALGDAYGVSNGPQFNIFKNISIKNFVSGGGGIYGCGYVCHYARSGGRYNHFYNTTILVSQAYGIYLFGRNTNDNLFDNLSITILNGGDNAFGIYQRDDTSNSGNNSFYSTTINSTNKSIVLSVLQPMNFIDFRIIGNDSTEIDAGGVAGVRPYFLNGSFDKTKVATTNPNLRFLWYADVHVVDSFGNDISNANVNISATNATENFNLTTNATGWIPRLNVTEYINYSGSVVNYTPHNIVASKTGYATNTTTGDDISGNRIFTIALALTPPYVVNILAPANNTWAIQRYLNITGICNSTTMPLVNVTFDYNGSSVANSSTITNGTIFYFNQSVGSDGDYYYSLTCYGSGSNTSETRLLKVDSIPPWVTIDQPLNGSNVNFSMDLTINITAYDFGSGLDKVVTNDSAWAGIFSPTGNYSNITNTSSITIGSHCVDITINDTAGNTNNADVCFTGIGSFVGIIAPSNNTWVAQRYLNVTAICNSTTLPFINASLNYNGTVQLNTSDVLNETPFYFNVSVPADGWYYYYVSCYSASAVEATSPSQYLKVDTTPPSVTINAPANGSVYFNNDSLTINITAMDSGIGVDEAVTNSTYWTGIYSPTGDYFNITNTSSILGAIYCVQATVNDSLNWQNSAYSCFTITDATNMSVSFIPPTPMTTSISQPWAFINVSYTNATSLHSIVLNWNGTNETNTMTCNYAEQYCYINKTGLATGNYTFYVYLNLTTGAYYQTGDNWVYAELCGNINTNTTLYSDINASGTCFVVTAPNLILDCNGYNLVGSGAGYGVYSNQENTTINNCIIRNFYSAITLNNTGGIAQVTSNNLINNWLGIELNSSSNGIIASNYLAGNGGGDIVSINSTNDLLPNSFAGTLAAFDYYSDNINFKTVPTLPALNSYSNGSSYFQINSTNASAWVLMNISYMSGMTPSSVGLYEYTASVWTGLGATHYTNATPQYFLLNTSSFGTYVVLGCPPAKPFYYGGACYAYMSISVATVPQYYKIGDVVTIFVTLSDPTAVASQVILYYANLGGTGYLQQSFTYDPINAQWVGAFKLRQHSEYLQVMALNATGSVIGYGEFYLTENKAPTWWDYFLWFFLALVILVVLVFVGKWIYETM